MGPFLTKKHHNKGRSKLRLGQQEREFLSALVRRKITNLSFFWSDSVNGKTTFDVVDESELLASFLDGDHICKEQRK